jgi:hypothetical protein
MYFLTLPSIQNVLLKYLGPGVEEEPGHLHMAVHGGLHQRRVHLVRLVLLVSARLQQEPHHLQVALCKPMECSRDYTEHTERPRPLQPRWREGWSTMEA